MNGGDQMSETRDILCRGDVKKSPHVYGRRSITMLGK